MKLYQKRIRYETYSSTVYTESGVLKDKASYYDEAKQLATEYIASLTNGLNKVLDERKTLQPKFDIVTSSEYFEIFGNTPDTRKAKKKTREQMERLNARVNHAWIEINKLKALLENNLDEGNNDLIEWFLKQEDIRYIEVEVIDD